MDKFVHPALFFILRRLPDPGIQGPAQTDLFIAHTGGRLLYGRHHEPGGLWGDQLFRV